MHIEFYRYLVQVQNRFMTNFYTIIKGEFGTFWSPPNPNPYPLSLIPEGLWDYGIMGNG